MRNYSATSQHGGLEISSNGVVDCLHSAFFLKIRLVFFSASLRTADVFPVVASRETKAEKTGCSCRLYLSQRDCKLLRHVAIKELGPRDCSKSSGVVFRVFPAVFARLFVTQQRRRNGRRLVHKLMNNGF